jgi:hypothetical protein
MHMERPSNSESVDERDIRAESAVLHEVVILHPVRLTSEELVVRMEDTPSDTGGVAILDSLQALKRCGLIRLNGELVEPTYAAVCAAKLFLP